LQDPTLFEPFGSIVGGTECESFSLVTNTAAR
jgi:hypothetical protein